MAKQTYEVIPYEQTNFLFSMGELTYVIPHIHREIEIALVLEGEIQLVSGLEKHLIHQGEFWVMNACQCHELYSMSEKGSSLFLELQVSTSFFRQCYHDIDKIRLERTVLQDHHALASQLLEMSKCYFEGKCFYELKCAGHIYDLFVNLLETVPYAIITEEEIRQNDFRMNRIQRMTDYIDEHISEKILLADLADRENLTLNYLSHFFKASFGMPFQTYLQHLRCRRAANLLLETDASPSDISVQCGFSALKYMNQGFEALFGCKPAEYRKRQRQQTVITEEPLGERPLYEKTLSPHLSNKKAFEYLTHMKRPDGAWSER